VGGTDHLMTVMIIIKWERTVRCPIASGYHTVYTLLRADLLAKRRDAGVGNESGVERIHAFPRCVSCMSPTKKYAKRKQTKPPSMSAAAGGCG
jgi:hypothetical protein